MKSTNYILFEGGMRGMGVTCHLSRLACELHRFSSDLKLIVVHDGTEQEEGLLHLLDKNGIDSFNYALDDIDRLLTQLSEDGYSIIFHAESYGGCRLIEPYKKKYHIHVLLGMNSYKYGSPYRSLVVKYIRFRYSKIVDNWIFFSQKARMEFCSSANVFNRTFVIPWGVEDFSKISLAKEYRDVFTNKVCCYDKGIKYIFYAAQFHAHKMHKQLILLLKDYLRNGKVKLMLGGDGVEMENIHNLCIKLGIDDNVVFMGRVPHPIFITHMKNAFLSLVLSKNETFGHCILEPLQLGIPVISTPTGIAPEIIHDFKNGFTIDRKNLEGWRQMIDLVLNDSIILKSEYQELYTWSEVALLYVNLYNYVGLINSKRQ